MRMANRRIIRKRLVRGKKRKMSESLRTGL